MNNNHFEQSPIKSKSPSDKENLILQVKEVTQQSKFIFRPPEGIEKQILKFQDCIQRKLWNGQISFKNFRGMFKLEYWGSIEEAFRKVQGFREFTFQNTKLDQEHLVLLRSLIQWVQPLEISLKFKRNELDDMDLEDFLIKWLLPTFGSRVKRLTIVNNPGVFKGYLVFQLKHNLKRMSHQDKQFNYHFVKNKEYKSIGFIRLLKSQQLEDPNLADQIQKFYKNLQQTCYFQLSLKECFTERSQQSFLQFIEQIFNDDQMECIESLDVGGCHLGSDINFLKMSKKLSSAKGLLSLGLSGQKHMHNSQLIQTLMGDRYDKIRINHIDIADNNDISELSVKILAENLLSKSLKTINFGETMNKGQNLEEKMSYIADAFFKQIEVLKKIMLKKNVIKKLKLNKLDLHKFDGSFRYDGRIQSADKNVDRPDLTKALLSSIVFNEFSSVKELIAQSLDSGRLKAQFESLDEFEHHILHMKKINPLYAKFLPKLKKMQMHFQCYKIEQEMFNSLMKRFYFTKSTDLLQIRKIYFHQCFNKEDRQDKFMNFMEKCLPSEQEKDPNVQYSLLHLTIDGGKVSGDFFPLFFKNIVFQKKFQLQSLTLINDTMSEDRDLFHFFQIGQKFLKSIPIGKYWTLRKLIIQDSCSSVNVPELIELLVFSDKVNLEVLILMDMYLREEALSIQSLKKRANSWEKPQTIHKLHLGEFFYKQDHLQRSHEYKAIVTLIEVLIFHPMSVVKELQLKKVDIQQIYFKLLHDQIKSNQKKGHKPMINLKTLIVDRIEYNSIEYNTEQWENFADIFLFGRDINLNHLELRNIHISTDFQQGFQRSYEKKLKYLDEINHQDSFCNSISNLYFKNCQFSRCEFTRCEFSRDILSLLFTAQKQIIQKLHIIGCKNIDSGFQEFKETYENNHELFRLTNFSVEELILDQIEIKEMEVFKWFLGEIIMNKKTQQLEHLRLSKCNLNDQHFIIINKILNDLYEYQNDTQQKGYFKIKKFNFDNNTQISKKQWRDFFDNLSQIERAEESEMIISGQVDQENFDADKEYQDQLKIKNYYCKLVKELIENNRLSIPEKIQVNPHKYTIDAPTQLYRLELNVSFEDENQKDKQRLYNRILKGLVYFVGSQLKELSLTQVDLTMFMIASQESQQFFIQKDCIPLKQLKLQSLQNLSQLNLRSLAMLYLSHLSINLESLIINYDNYEDGKLYQDIAQSIEEGLNTGKLFALQTLKLNFYNRLNVEQTLQFFKTVIFNKLVPLTSLEIGLGVHLESEQEFQQQIIDHLIKQDFQCPLKEVSITISKSSWSTNKTIGLIFPLLIEGNFILLDKLSFCSSWQFRQCVKFYINPYSQQQLDNFNITYLTLDYMDSMLLEDFKFLYYIRPKLQVLNLNLQFLQFQDPEDISQFLDSQSDSKLLRDVLQPCQLQLSFSNSKQCSTFNQEGEIMKKFVYGESFKWSDVNITELRNKQVFHYPYPDKLFIVREDIKLYLRTLKISFDPAYSQYECQNDSYLRIIGDNLIYDKKSILEELCLIRMDQNILSLKALTSKAQAFRDETEKGFQQKTTNLSLKRFCIHGSLQITNEGAEMISRDIFFFEYITIERIEIYKTQWNSEMMILQCEYAQDWLRFQSKNDRNNLQFSLKYVDWGSNLFVQSRVAWFLLCDTFLFSDKAPFIEVVNLHNMGIEDKQINWICQRADQYFTSKPQNYIHPLKRLIFSGKSTVSSKSWGQLSEKFLFSQNVELEEIDFKNTRFNNQEKMDSIYLAASFRASKRSDKILALHTLLTNNIQLKQIFSEIISERPIDYQPLQDSSSEHDTYLKHQEDEIPNSLGQIISIVTKNLYKEKQFTNINWDIQSQLRFSEYHLDVVSGLLNPLNQFFQKNIKYQGQIHIDLTVCDELCTMIKYTQGQRDPYPYKLFFTPDAIQFYTQPFCAIRVINFILTDMKNAEQVDQFQIFTLWELLLNKETSLDVVFIDYRLDDDLVDFMLQKGYNERDLISLVRLFPPSSLRLQETLSLQALKAIYSIMYDNYQFNYANILYDKNSFLNVGIGYSLREYVYRTNPTGFIGRKLKIAFYYIFNVFVTPVSEYEFTRETKQLNEFLSTQRKYFIVLTLETIIFYVICLFGPYGWQHFFYGDDLFGLICYDGISPETIYYYLLFAFVSFIVEASFFWKVSKIISNQIQGFIGKTQEQKFPKQKNINQVEIFDTPQTPFEQKSRTHAKPLSYDQDQGQFLIEGSPQGLEEKAETEKSNKNSKNKQKNIRVITAKLSSSVKSFAKSQSGRKLGYLINLSYGQLSKLNLYTDVNFIMLTYYCQFNYIALFAVITTSFNVYFQLYNLIKIILAQFFSSHTDAKILSTKFINDFYELSTIGRNIALSNILDSVAPYNVTVISNNFITRTLFPQFAGKSMSNSVRAYVFKFALGDLPHIILQLYFVVYIAYYPVQDPYSLVEVDLNPTKIPAKQQLGPAIYITLISTGISILVSFIKFMSIRPSTLSQADFDILDQKKTKKFVLKQIKYVEKELQIFHCLTNELRIKKLRKLKNQ